MGEAVFVFLCINTVLFSFVFWVLTWVFRFFYTNKQKKRKLEFYECGFTSNIGVKIQVSLPYCLIVLFFLLYDLEFIGFFFFSFFYETMLIQAWVSFFVFFCLLLICFLLDYALSVLDFITKM